MEQLDRVQGDGQTTRTRRAFRIEEEAENSFVTEQLHTMPRFLSKGILYLILLILSAAALFAALSRVDVVISCRAVARSDVRETRLLSPGYGRIDATFVVEGQVVREGSPLFLLTSVPHSDVISGGEDQSERLRIVVRADRAGIVSALPVDTVGSDVVPDQWLCSLLPSEGPLYVDILATNGEIAELRKGMPVKYKFDAYPFGEFGTLTGVVEAIPPAAVEDRAGGLVFHVRGTLVSSHFEVGGRRLVVAAGMTATADLVSETRTLLSLVVQAFAR